MAGRTNDRDPGPPDRAVGPNPVAGDGAGRIQGLAAGVFEAAGGAHKAAHVLVIEVDAGGEARDVSASLIA